MRTKKFVYNSIGAALLQVVNMFAGLVLSRTVLSYFGSEINGLVTSLTQFAAYFTLVEAGISESVVFSLYKPLADHDFTGVSAIVIAAKKYFNKAGVFFVCLITLLSLTAPLFMKTTVLSKYEIVVLTFIIGMSGILDFFIMAKYRTLLTADQRVYVLSMASALSNILNVLIVMILSRLSFSIVIVRFFALFSVLLRSFILYFYTKRKYTFLNFKSMPNNSALGMRWNAFYLQLLGVFQNGIPIVLATFFTSLKEVSVYSVYLLIVAGIKSMLSIFESGLPAAFGEVLAKNEKEVLKKAADEFECLYYALISVIYTTAFFLILPFIALYTHGVNDVQYADKWLALLFILDGLFYNMKTPQGMLVLSAGLYKETRRQTTVQAMIILVGGIILAPKFGLYGILLASISANVYRTIDLLFFIPKYVTHRAVGVTMKREIGAILFFGCGIIIERFFPISFASNYFQWLLSAIAVCAVLSLCMLMNMFIFEKDAFQALVSRCKTIVKIR